MARKSEEAAESYEEPLGTLLLEVDDGKRVMAEVSTFNDVRYLSIRQWIRKRDGTWTRTRNGLSIPTAKARKLSAKLAKYVEPT